MQTEPLLQNPPAASDPKEDLETQLREVKEKIRSDYDRAKKITETLSRDLEECQGDVDVIKDQLTLIHKVSLGESVGGKKENG